MVNNLTRILDCGELKYIDECKGMPVNYFERYEKDYWHNDDLHKNNLERVRLYTKQLNEWKLAQAYMKATNDIYSKEYQRYASIDKPKEPVMTAIPVMKHFNDMSKQDIMDYYGEKVFHRCIMVNISPNWKGKFMKGMLGKRNFMKQVILKFFKNCDRFTKIAYAIECGSDADFTHAHCVLEFNPGKLNSSMKSHRKGNLMTELRKLWDKTSKQLDLPFEGLLKGRFALQTTLINNNEILQDKLDYLIEEKKPESHQNLVCPGYPSYENLGFD
jgi:hypothetical protein